MKNTQTPGTVLNEYVEKHGLNCNRLAKAINMSNAMVRLLLLDKSPISVGAALRLAAFFKNTPKFWLELQMEYALAEAGADKKLAKDLSEIVDVTKYTFERKPHAPRGTKVKGPVAAKGKKPAAAGKGKAAPKGTGAKRGRKPAK